MSNGNRPMSWKEPLVMVSVACATAFAAIVVGIVGRFTLGPGPCPTCTDEYLALGPAMLGAWAGAKLALRVARRSHVSATLVALLTLAIGVPVGFTVGVHDSLAGNIASLPMTAMAATFSIGAWLVCMTKLGRLPVGLTEDRRFLCSLLVVVALGMFARWEAERADRHPLRCGYPASHEVQSQVTF